MAIFAGEFVGYRQKCLDIYDPAIRIVRVHNNSDVEKGKLMWIGYGFNGCASVLPTFSMLGIGEIENSDGPSGQDSW